LKLELSLFRQLSPSIIILDNAMAATKSDDSSITTMTIVDEYPYKYIYQEAAFL
jgi:hypothetical protein